MDPRGAQDRELLEAIQMHYPGTDGAALVRSVYQKIESCGSPNAKAVKGWALLSFRMLYQKMVEIGDYDGARKVIGDMLRIVK